jgi:hypothetical protein
MKRTIAFALPLSVMLAGGLAISAADAAQVFYPLAYPYGASFSADQYTGPHGRYGSQTGFIRSLEGIPCGFNCSARAAVRWHRAY